MPTNKLYLFFMQTPSTIYNFRSLITVLFTLLLLHTSFLSAQQKLTLKQFVSLYIQNNESLKNNELQQQIDILQSEALNDHFKAELNINPQRTQLKDNNIYTNKLNTDTLTTDLSFHLPTGTQVSVGAVKWLSNEPVHKPVDHNLYINLQQSLLRNLFGSNQSKDKQLAELGQSLADLNFSIKAAEICQNAINVYTDTFKSQENLKIINELYTSSQKVFKSIKKSYRNKTIRKLDYLNSENDHLNSEQSLLNAQMTLKNEQRKLLTSFSNNIKYPGQLLLMPPEDFSGLIMNTQAQISPLYTELLEKKVIQAQLIYQKSKNLQKPDLKAYLSASQNKDQHNNALSSNDLQNIEYGLNLTIPIGHKTLTSSTKKNYLAWMQAKNEKTLQLRQWQQQLNYIKKYNDILAQQKKLLRKQKVVLKKQSSEAYRLLRSGQVEFIDYTVYRNQLVQLQQKEIEINRELANNYLQYLVLVNPSKDICKEVLI